MARLASESNPMCHELRVLVYLVLEQIAGCCEKRPVGMSLRHAARTAFQTAGVVVSLRSSFARSNCPLRMRCISPMPAKGAYHVPDRLKPSMTFVLNLTLRWPCSIKLFRYFEDRTLVPSSNTLSAFISRTARCEAA